MYLSKILLVFFLIFLNCYTSHSISREWKSIIKQEGRKQRSYSSLGIKSTAAEYTVHEQSISVASQDKCDGVICQNNGTCYISNGKARCECPNAPPGSECKILTSEEICDIDFCEDEHSCNCCPGYSEIPVSYGMTLGLGFCKECHCRKRFNCTFLRDESSYKLAKICHCGIGYIDVNGKCINEPCRINPCRNNGECIVSEGKAICECKGDFSGDFCEETLENKCQLYKPNCEETGGICVSDEHEQIKCKCPATTTYMNGKGCQAEEYVNYLCNNTCSETGGFCVIETNHTAKCMCPEGAEYRHDSGCTSSLENKCQLYKPNCEETGGICVSDEHEQIKCKCPASTTYMNGKGCQDLTRDIIYCSIISALLSFLLTAASCLLYYRYCIIVKKK